MTKDTWVIFGDVRTKTSSVISYIVYLPASAIVMGICCFMSQNKVHCVRFQHQWEDV